MIKLTKTHMKGLKNTSGTWCLTVQAKAAVKKKNVAHLTVRT
jgi:hypothetical protein